LDNSVERLLLLLLGVASQLQTDLFSSDLAHLQAQASEQLVFGFPLVNLVGRLLAHDCLGVFVDDLYQVNKLMEHVGDFHDLLLLIRHSPSLANAVKQVEIVQDRIVNKAEKDDREQWVLQESLLALLPVPIADVSENLDVRVQSAFLRIFRFIKLVI
jgi:hypothetical protein